MARIKLIVTGDLEKLALSQSLKKHFPSTHNGKNVIWDEPRKTHGATSYQLQPLSAGNSLSNPMIELAKAMLAEALEGKKKGQNPAFSYSHRRCGTWKFRPGKYHSRTLSGCGE
ncbi:MAG: hypothetical protein PHH59_14490 [Methylovulum sp.]|uniref:hypothetical protein n=1 Tax=Methylovulum sp. TaxID=1916980 RepID=UPI00262667EF|nr:hypothetical protein [Methylovulum sp.]MDD2725213.1 hypothetical protein [Methylovulum sp.]MDD5125604.1 hypothetical protein [Methylovulum sp.]